MAITSIGFILDDDPMPELIVDGGLASFDIDSLAARAHCSRATIYRHVGGKAEIRDGVLIRGAARIVDTVRRTVEGMSGPDRVVTAIAVALDEIISSCPASQ